MVKSGDVLAARLASVVRDEDDAKTLAATDHVAHHRIVLNLKAVEFGRAKAVGVKPKARPPRQLQRCRAGIFWLSPPGSLVDAP